MLPFVMLSTFPWGVLVPKSTPSRGLVLGTAGITAVVVFICLAGAGTGATGRALALAGICLSLWLAEVVRPWVPTVLLLLLTPLILGPTSDRFGVLPVAGWLLEPVLALFLAGFALGAVAERLGLDSRFAQSVIRGSAGSPTRLVGLTGLLTAGLSMWLSNVAAAALMIGALRPLLRSEALSPPVRRALLLALAMGANIGGMATPIGTGPNGLAIAALEGRREVSFLDWMAFGGPLSGLLLGGLLLGLWASLRGQLRIALPVASNRKTVLPSGARRFGVLFAGCVGLWLTQPWHGIPAWQVALATVLGLALAGLLGSSEVRQMDWSTLALVAGGIALGRVLELSGTVRLAAEAVPWDRLPSSGRLLVLCAASATLAALMSNTAATAMLIPLGSSLVPGDATPILVALAASLGAPLVISTPANAMAFGEGGLRSRDLLISGGGLMVVGLIVLVLAGETTLNWLARFDAR